MRKSTLFTTLLCMTGALLLGMQSCKESYEDFEIPKETTPEPENPGEDPGETIPEDKYSKKFADWADRAIYNVEFSSKYINNTTDTTNVIYSGLKITVSGNSPFLFERKEFSGYYGCQATSIEITSVYFSKTSGNETIEAKYEINSSTAVSVYPKEPLEINGEYKLFFKYKLVVYNGTGFPTKYPREEYFYYDNYNASASRYITWRDVEYPGSILYLHEYPEIFVTSKYNLKSLFPEGTKPLFAFRDKDWHYTYKIGELRIGKETKDPNALSEVAVSLEEADLKPGYCEYRLYAYKEGDPYPNGNHLHVRSFTVSKYDYHFDAVKAMNITMSVDTGNYYNYLTYNIKLDEAIDDNLTVAPDLQNTIWYTANYPRDLVSTEYKNIYYRNGERIVRFTSEAYTEWNYNNNMPEYTPGNYPLMFTYTVPGIGVTSTSSKDVMYMPMPQ